MAGTENPSWFSLPTGIGGSVKFSVGIANQFRTHIENRMDHAVKSIIVHSNQSTITVHSDSY